MSRASLLRCAEAKALLRKAIPVAQRVIGENDELTLRMRWTYAGVLVTAGGATLDDLREAVATLESRTRLQRESKRYPCQKREPRSAPARRYRRYVGDYIYHYTKTTRTTSP